MQRFIESEREYWEELESILDRVEKDLFARLSLSEVKNFHYLYQRVSAGLAKVSTLSSEQETRVYLESLVARAYAEAHETRSEPYRLAPLRWFFNTLPRTFRRHSRAFCVSLAAMLLGYVFGGMALALDSEAREAVIPPAWHLRMDPSKRVAQEESATADRLAGRKTAGAAWYMTHNTRVAMQTVAAGITYGILTLIMLFYNGIVLGAICTDYILAGKTEFLIGWLLPHGSVEIPAILLAGQAGLVLASALVGWGKRATLKMRLREILPDLATLILGVIIFLVWAGFVEAFLSQYHEPTIPYSLKIGFGVVELSLLILFLSRSGRRGRHHERENKNAPHPNT
jgi:uncharacterized membrane protein SpoIIM required for sporulation